MLFGFDYYYPSGGLNDLIGSYDTVEQAFAEINIPKDAPYKHEHYQIYDIVEGVQINFYPEQNTLGIPIDSKDYFDNVNEHSRTIDETYKKEKL